MRRRTTAVLGVSLIIAAIIIGSFTAFSLYEVRGSLQKVHTISNSWFGNGPVDVWQTASEGSTQIRVDSNQGEEGWEGYAGTPTIYFQVGAPDVIVQMSTIQHGTFESITAATGWTQQGETIYQDEVKKSTSANTTYYYDRHLYVFHITAKTDAEVKNYDFWTALWWNYWHHGQVDGYEGTSVNAIAYVIFSIHPWEIQGQVGQNYTDPDGNVYKCSDAWAGIMRAWVAGIDSGPLTDVTPTKAGSVTGLPNIGQELSMYDLNGKSLGKGITFSSASESAIRGIPMEAQIEVPTGTLMAGYVADNTAAKDISPINYYSDIFVVIEVLQTKGFTLILPKTAGFEVSGDDITQTTDWTVYWPWIVGGALFIIVLAFILRPRAQTKIYTGRAK